MGILLHTERTTEGPEHWQWVSLASHGTSRALLRNDHSDIQLLLRPHLRQHPPDEVPSMTKQG